MRRSLVGAFFGAIGFLSCGSPAEPDPPEDFPRFVVPGKEKAMESLRRLFWLHYRRAGPLIPLWDEWMPMSTLWPALGSGKELETMRVRWARALAGRIIDDEGCVHTQQHDGLAHAAGWPFPLWTQAGGAGWHFRGTGVPGYDAPPCGTEGWKLRGGRVRSQACRDAPQSFHNPLGAPAARPSRKCCSLSSILPAAASSRGVASPATGAPSRAAVRPPPGSPLL